MTPLKGDGSFFSFLLKSKYVFFNDSASSQAALNQKTSNNLLALDVFDIGTEKNEFKLIELRIK